jgi:hypothetical protein
VHEAHYWLACFEVAHSAPTRGASNGISAVFATNFACTRSRVGLVSLALSAHETHRFQHVAGKILRPDYNH